MAEGSFRLRLSYTKLGRLRYLSHLEMVRCLERCIRRAGLPFGVTQGFSPHMKHAFGWALPVGVGSMEEYADVWLLEHVRPNDVLAAFEDAVPYGLQVTSATYVDPKGDSLETAFPYADYEVLLVAREEAAAGTADASHSVGCSGTADASRAVGGAGTVDTLGLASTHTVASLSCASNIACKAEEALDLLMMKGHITVVRKGKEKKVEFNGLLCGRPEIFCGAPAASDLASAPGGNAIMRMTTFTEGKGSLRPDLFVSALEDLSDGALRRRAITRISQRPSLPNFSAVRPQDAFG